MEKMKAVPVLRFPEFLREWVSSNLGNIATFSKGKGVSKADITEDGELECIRYGELYTHYGETIDSIKSKTNLSRKECVLSEANDVIIPASGESQLDIATASCVLKSGVALGGDLNIIKSPIDGVFLSYYLNTKKKHEIAALAQGISVVHLYSRQLKTLSLNIPTDGEQQKISAFLNAVDDKIRQLQKKKELLEQYKKGIMQRIFNQEIRFKDDDGNEYPDWERKKAKEVFKNHTNKKHDGSLPILAITQEHGAVLRDSIGKDIQSSEESIKSYKIVDQGDFIISLRSFQGGIEYSNVSGICSPAYTILKPQIPLVSIFFKYFLKKDSFIQELSNSVIGIRDGKQISFEVFGNLRLPFPSIEEQTEIADFLYSIDDKISLVSKQLEHTKHFKKGLLQQMFV